MLILLILYFGQTTLAKDIPINNILCNYDPANRELVNSGRLPKNVKPKTYYLSYLFNENMDTYNASTDIHVTIVSPTKTIVLHSDNHEVLSVSLIKNQDLGSDTSYTEISEICFLQETQMMILKLSREMNAGEQATISIMFRGNVSGSLNGIYSSVYVSKSNETKKTIATHFEPDFARTAFPCFDEPSFKAVFVIKLAFPKTYKALSNAAILKRDLIDTTTLSVEFKPTVLMSSYLVAFAIHDFDSISAVTKSGTKVNVWLPSDSIEHGKFAIELAPKALETYERLFNIPYQLEKLDLIGIPGFEAGAMENWGLITFRMTALLVNLKLSSTWTKQNVGQVIVHELAHQWFGNLVTMEWWNDIWLNEGFATFMEFYVMDKHFPTWRIMDQLSYTVTLSAMSYDQMTVTHPLSVPDEVVQNIHLLFDHVSYDKGASILSMLMNTLGEDLFFKCIQKYLKTFAYSNANSHDLWFIVKNESQIDNIEPMMKAWTHQPGFPLITVQKSNKTGWYNVHQCRFIVTSDEKKRVKEDDPTVWIVPIVYITASDNKPKLVWLNGKDDYVNLSTKDEWVKINHRFGYYYRSHYDEESIVQLSRDLMSNNSILHPMDKLSIISDLMTVARIGRLNISTAFFHFEYLKNETDLYVISEFFSHLKYIHRIIRDMDDIKTKFENYSIGFSRPIIDRLGYDLHSDRQTRLLQTLAISTNIAFEEKETLDRARTSFKKYIDEKTPIDPDILTTYACGYVKLSTDKEWEQLLQIFIATSDPIEKEIYRIALSCSKNVLMLERLLNMSLDPTIIPLQDSRDVILDVSRSPFGANLAWNFIKQNWKKIQDQMSDVPHSFSRLVAGAAGRLKTLSDFDDVKACMARNNIEFLKSGFEESLESIGNSIYWVSKNVMELRSYLDSYR